MKTAKKPTDNDSGFRISSLKEKRQKHNCPKALKDLWLLAVRSDKPGLAEYVENLRKKELEKVKNGQSK